MHVCIIYTSRKKDFFLNDALQTRYFSKISKTRNSFFKKVKHSSAPAV